MIDEIDLKNEIEKQFKNCVFQEKSKILNVTKFKNLNLEIDKFHSTKENIPFYGKISLQLENENGVIEETYDYKGNACVKENIVITMPEYISVSRPNSLG